MKLSLWFFFGFLTVSSVYGYEVEGVLQNLASSREISEGESFDAHIDIWPMADESLEAIKGSLENKSFLDYFYIGKVNNIKFSENNSDVVVVNAKVVLVKSYEERPVFIWTYKSLTIPFALKNISPQKSNIGKEFIILNQQDGFLAKKYNLFFIMTFLTFLLISFVVIRKFLLTRKLRIESLRVRQKWSELFLSASDRRDVENIYKLRNEWLDIIGGETPPILNFFTLLDSVQYKKNWTDIEEHKVLEAFDDIRGIFERA